MKQENGMKYINKVKMIVVFYLSTLIISVLI